MQVWEKKEETKLLCYITGVLKQVDMERFFTLSSNTRIRGH